ncbi:MAG: TetR/AcrR family transcriptional regulator [Propionibacteriaceae bacterium]
MSTPEKVDGRKLRRSDTKVAILDAALALFARHGVTATSVDDIAAKAGIAKGSIYYNFASKDVLTQELMAFHIRRLHERIEEAAASGPGAQGRRAIAEALLSEMEEHTDVAQLMMSQMFRSDKSWLDGVARWRSTITDPLTNNLVEERGEDYRPLAEVQASAIVGATLSAGLDWLILRQDLRREDVVEALARLTQSS